MVNIASDHEINKIVLLIVHNIFALHDYVYFHKVHTRTHTNERQQHMHLNTYEVVELIIRSFCKEIYIQFHVHTYKHTDNAIL